jgi:hypothetical protein
MVNVYILSQQLMVEEPLFNVSLVVFNGILPCTQSYIESIFESRWSIAEAYCINAYWNTVGILPLLQISDICCHRKNNLSF